MVFNVPSSTGDCIWHPLLAMLIQLPYSNILFSYQNLIFMSVSRIIRHIRIVTHNTVGGIGNTYLGELGSSLYSLMMSDRSLNFWLAVQAFQLRRVHHDCLVFFLPTQYRCFGIVFLGLKCFIVQNTVVAQGIDIVYCLVFDSHTSLTLAAMRYILGNPSLH